MNSSWLIDLVRLDKKSDGGRKNFSNISKALNRNGFRVNCVFVQYLGFFSYLNVFWAVLLSNSKVIVVNQALLALVFRLITFRKIFYIVDSIDNNYPRTSTMNYIKSWVVVLENYILAVSPGVRIFCETNYVKSRFGFLGKGLRVLHTPYPCNEGGVVKETMRNRLLYVGRLDGEKGVANLIDFARGNEDFLITVVGDGSLINLFEEEEVKNIQLRGWLNWDELVEEYISNDVFVHFPLSDAYPTVFREAMSFGMPVVSLKMQGIPEIVDSGSNGILLNYYESTAAREAVLTIGRQMSKYSMAALRKSRCNDFDSYALKLKGYLDDFVKK